MARAFDTVFELVFALSFDSTPYTYISSLKSLQLKEKDSYKTRYVPLRSDFHLLEKPIHQDKCKYLNVARVGIYLISPASPTLPM